MLQRSFALQGNSLGGGATSILEPETASYATELYGLEAAAEDWVGIRVTIEVESIKKSISHVLQVGSENVLLRNYGLQSDPRGIPLIPGSKIVIPG